MIKPKPRGHQAPSRAKHYPLEHHPFLVDVRLRVESGYAAAMADFVRARSGADEAKIPLLLEDLCTERFNVLTRASAWYAKDRGGVRADFIDILRSLKARVEKELADELSNLTLDLHPRWKTYTAERVAGLLEEQVYRCLAEITEAIRVRPGVGQIIETLRRLCDWSYDELSEEMGKRNKSDIIKHIKHNRVPGKRLLNLYAVVFSRKLQPAVTVDELLGRVIVDRTTPKPHQNHTASTLT